MSVPTRRKSVKDFQFGNRIGEGSYSTVYKAVDVFTRKVFAIKILSKNHIVKEKKIKYVNIEKQTLNRLGHHPGIVTLYYTFQDESSLFFVIDFAEYGELLSLIRKLGSLNEVSTRYYMVQLIDAIKFMHSKGVIHRDLKPENILLNHDMKLMITDFGAAKMVDENGNPEESKMESPVSMPESKETAASFVGTAEYVSPELLQHNECGFESDIWAVGCILYQFIVGMPPFKGSTEYLTFEKIINLEYKFPTFYIPEPIKHLIVNILILDPKKRYTITDMQNHAFFKGVPWTDFNYIWKRNPPKIESYDPRSFQAKPAEKTPKVVHKQPMNFYKKPQASSSKTLDMINSTYVPSSSVMPGSSPKKLFQPAHAGTKPYPKVNQFARGGSNGSAVNSNNIGLGSTTGIGIKTTNQTPTSQTTGGDITPSPPSQRYQPKSQSPLQAIPQPYQLQPQNPGPIQQQFQTPVQQTSRQVSSNTANHEKQNSNNSIQSQMRSQANFYYGKPTQPKAQYSQSQPTSPISLDTRKVSNSSDIQKPVLMDHTQILQKQIQLTQKDDSFPSPVITGQVHPKSSLPNMKSEPEEPEATDTQISAASEAILNAQKLRLQNDKSHPYALMKIKTNGGSDSFTSERITHSGLIKPEVGSGRTTPIEQSFSVGSTSFINFDNPEKTLLSQMASSSFTASDFMSNEGDLFSSPTIPGSPGKNLTVNTSLASSIKDELISPTGPFAKSRSSSRNSSFRGHQQQNSIGSSLKQGYTNDSVSHVRSEQAKAMASPNIYCDKDIKAEENDHIPGSVTRLLSPDERIIKLDTVLVSELKFVDIKTKDPSMILKNEGTKLILNDNTINEIIASNGMVIDYYSRPEVMLVTTTGRLFILKSIALLTKLFEITLTDTRISLYDYEFDEAECTGYLILELIDRQSILFLSPHDHKHVNINFEVNSSITWIECLFKAKQLLKPLKRKDSKAIKSPNPRSPSGAKRLSSSGLNGSRKVKNGHGKGKTPLIPNSTSVPVTAAAAAAAAAINKEYR